MGRHGLDDRTLNVPGGGAVIGSSTLYFTRGVGFVSPSVRRQLFTFSYSQASPRETRHYSL